MPESDSLEFFTQYEESDDDDDKPRQEIDPTPHANLSINNPRFITPAQSSINHHHRYNHSTQPNQFISVSSCSPSKKHNHLPNNLKLEIQKKKHNRQLQPKQELDSIQIKYYPQREHKKDDKNYANGHSKHKTKHHRRSRSLSIHITPKKFPEYPKAEVPTCTRTHLPPHPHPKLSNKNQCNKQVNTMAPCNISWGPAYIPPLDLSSRNYTSPNTSCKSYCMTEDNTTLQPSPVPFLSYHRHQNQSQQESLFVTGENRIRTQTTDNTDTKNRTRNCPIYQPQNPNQAQAQQPSNLAASSSSSNSQSQGKHFRPSKLAENLSEDQKTKTFADRIHHSKEKVTDMADMDSGESEFADDESNHKHEDQDQLSPATLTQNDGKTYNSIKEYSNKVNGMRNEVSSEAYNQSEPDNDDSENKVDQDEGEDHQSQNYQVKSGKWNQNQSQNYNDLMAQSQTFNARRTSAHPEEIIQNTSRLRQSQKMWSDDNKEQKGEHFHRHSGSFYPESQETNLSREFSRQNLHAFETNRRRASNDPQTSVTENTEAVHAISGNQQRSQHSRYKNQTEYEEYEENEPDNIQISTRPTPKLSPNESRPLLNDIFFTSVQNLPKPKAQEMKIPEPDSATENEIQKLNSNSRHGSLPPLQSQSKRQHRHRHKRKCDHLLKKTGENEKMKISCSKNSNSRPESGQQGHGIDQEICQESNNGVSATLFPFRKTPSGNFKIEKEMIAFESKQVAVLVDDRTRTHISFTQEKEYCPHIIQTAPPIPPICTNDSDEDRQLSTPFCSPRTCSTTKRRNSQYHRTCSPTCGFSSASPFDKDPCGRPTQKNIKNARRHPDDKKLPFSQSPRAESLSTSHYPCPAEYSVPEGRSQNQDQSQEQPLPCWDSDTENQCHNANDFMESLHYRLRRAIRPDMKIVIDDKEFPCHSIALTAYSKYFDCLIRPQETIHHVNLPKDYVSPEDFPNLMDWILLNDECKPMVISQENVLSLYVAAQYLGIPGLREHCLCFINDKIHTGDPYILQMYEEACKKPACTGLLTRLTAKLTELFPMVYKSRQFLSLNAEDLMILIGSDCVKIHSELQIYDTAVRWLLFDWEYRQHWAIPVMNCVRFGLLSPLQLTQIQHGTEVTQMPDYNCIFSIQEIKDMLQDGLTYAIFRENYKTRPAEFNKWIECSKVQAPRPRLNIDSNPDVFLPSKSSLPSYRSYCFEPTQNIQNQAQDNLGKIKETDTVSTLGFYGYDSNTPVRDSPRNLNPSSKPTPFLQPTTSPRGSLDGRSEKLKAKSFTPQQEEAVSFHSTPPSPNSSSRPRSQSHSERRRSSVTKNDPKQLRHNSLPLPGSFGLQNEAITEPSFNTENNKDFEKAPPPPESLSRPRSQSQSERRRSSVTKNDPKQLRHNSLPLPGSFGLQYEAITEPSFKTEDNLDKNRDGLDNSYDSKSNNSHRNANSYDLNHQNFINESKSEAFQQSPVLQSPFQNQKQWMPESPYQNQTVLLPPSQHQHRSSASYDSRHNEAATKIQASFRDYLLRKNLNSTRNQFEQDKMDSSVEEKVTPENTTSSRRSSNLKSNPKSKPKSLLIPGREVILVFGGMNPQEEYSNDNNGSGENDNNCANIYRFNPEDNAWEYVGHMPEPRSHCGVVNEKELIYLFGGTDPLTFTPIGKPLPTSTCWSFNPKTHEWVPLARMKTPRTNFGYCHYKGKIYIFGGKSIKGTSLSSCERFDPKHGKWEYIAPMQVSCMSMAVSVLGDTIYVVGGVSATTTAKNGKRPILKTVQTYQPKVNEWSYDTPLSTGRCYAQLIHLNLNQLYLVGGAGKNSDYDVSARSMKDVLILEDGEWEQVGKLKKARHGHCMVKMGKHLVIMGGVSSDSMEPLDTVEIYNTQTNRSSTRVASMPQKLTGMAAVVV